MRLPMHAVAMFIWVVCLLVNLAFWAGVGGSAVLGPSLREPLRVQAPLAYSYLLLGEALTAPLGMTESMAGFAEANVERHAYVTEMPAVAVDRLMAARSGWVGSLHLAPLWLLPVVGFLWWRRPRKLQTFGRR
jgi:hypothetical protein